MLIESIDLDTAINDLAHDFYLLAKAFSSPSVSSCICNIAFSHKVVELIRIEREDVVTTDKT